MAEVYSDSEGDEIADLMREERLKKRRRELAAQRSRENHAHESPRTPPSPIRSRAMPSYGRHRGDFSGSNRTASSSPPRRRATPSYSDSRRAPSSHRVSPQSGRRRGERSLDRNRRELSDSGSGSHGRRERFGSSHRTSPPPSSFRNVQPQPSRGFRPASPSQTMGLQRDVSRMVGARQWRLSGSDDNTASVVGMSRSNVVSSGSVVGLLGGKVARIWHQQRQQGGRALAASSVRRSPSPSDSTPWMSAGNERGVSHMHHQQGRAPIQLIRALSPSDSTPQWEANERDVSYLQAQSRVARRPGTESRDPRRPTVGRSLPVLAPFPEFPIKAAIEGQIRKLEVDESILLRMIEEERRQLDLRNKGGPPARASRVPSRVSSEISVDGGTESEVVPIARERTPEPVIENRHLLLPPAGFAWNAFCFSLFCKGNPVASATPVKIDGGTVLLCANCKGTNRKITSLLDGEAHGVRNSGDSELHDVLFEYFKECKSIREGRKAYSDFTKFELDLVCELLYRLQSMKRVPSILAPIRCVSAVLGKAPALLSEKMRCLTLESNDFGREEVSMVRRQNQASRDAAVLLRNAIEALWNVAGANPGSVLEEKLGGFRSLLCKCKRVNSQDRKVAVQLVSQAQHNVAVRGLLHDGRMLPFRHVNDIFGGKASGLAVPVCVVNEMDDTPFPRVEFCNELKMSPAVREKAMTRETLIQFVAGCGCVGGCSQAACVHVEEYPVELRGMMPYTTDDKPKLREPFLENEGLAIFECNSQCCCGSWCCNRVVQQGSVASFAFEVHRLGKIGWGVLAAELIPKGSYVAEYTGEIVDGEEADRRGEDYDATGCNFLFDMDHMQERGDKNACSIDATKCGNIARFFNHSCDPALVVKPVYIDEAPGVQELHFHHIAFFARRDIKKGEQLTVDYKYQLCDDLQMKIDCLCGAACCRGRLR